MMRVIIFAAALFYFSAGAAELKCFKYYKDAATENANPLAVSSIILDNEVYRQTSDLSSDLRIIGENNREIPFALRRVYLKDTRKSRQSFAGNIESLKKVENKVVIIISQKKIPVDVDAVTIETPDRDFEKNISIAGSNDKKNWREIVNGQAVFDYSGIIALRKLEVKIPASNYKYFRVSIDNFTEEKTSPIRQMITEEQAGTNAKRITAVIQRKAHIRIDAVKLTKVHLSKTNSSLKKQVYPINISRIITKGKETIISLNNDSEPLSAIILSTSSTNFSRNITLSGSNDNKNWLVITSSEWTKSNIFNQQSAPQKTIVFVEKRFRFYRIKIENGDNPPLQNIQVTARGNIYRLVMLGRQNLKLKLYYGGTAPRPQYEIAKLLPAILDVNEINYKLTGEKLNPEFNLSTPETVNYKWVFTIIIIITAIILIYILYKNIGKLNNLETE